MFVIVVVSFFSFRILLQELGEVGYGLYNVVGGVVIIFGFLSSALTQSSQRYFSYCIGKKDYDLLQRTFSMSVNVHILMIVIILILAETIGLWFLNTKMNLPKDLYHDANIVYQVSILTFLVQIIIVPFQASIISFEKMSFYAYFSLSEALLKLSAVFLLFVFDSNKVVIYSIALFCVNIIVLVVYYIFCRVNFPPCRYIFITDRKLFKELTSFLGWNTLGGISNIAASQGVNIVFNLFCGVIVNAAMGVSHQVSNAVVTFVSNMQMAFNPQIIKSYAAGNTGAFYSLVFRSSRFSYLLIFILGFPVIIGCQTVFDMWLTEIPAYAVPFTQCIIAFCMIDALSGSLWTSAQATGKIRNYMIIMFIMISSNVVAAYIILDLGFSPVYVMIYKVLMNLLIHFTRLIYLHKIINFPSGKYMKCVMLRVAIFTILSLPLPFFLNQYVTNILHGVLFMVAIALQSCILGYLILLTNSERDYIISILSKHILRIKQ